MVYFKYKYIISYMLKTTLLAITNEYLYNIIYINII